MDTFTDLALVADSTLRLSVPLIFACLAGLYSERSGVIDIGLEGKMLAGAFASAVMAHLTGSALVGLLGAVLVSTSLSLVHGVSSISYRGNQIVSGTAINMLALGLTALLGNTWYGQGGRTPPLQTAERFLPVSAPGVANLRDIPVLGSLYASVASGHDVLTYMSLVAVPFTAWLLYRTRFGLRLRAVGENPAAVDTAGISVAWLRYRAVLLTGVLTGFAGAYLSLAQSAQFVPNMSAGQGFMALAALIFAKWRPWPALGTCLIIGLLNALSNRLQGVPLPLIRKVPGQAIQVMPYVLTVILLAGFGGAANPPRASGIPYLKGQR